MEGEKNPLNIPYLGDVGKKPSEPEVSKLLRKILSSKSKYPEAKL